MNRGYTSYTFFLKTKKEENNKNGKEEWKNMDESDKNNWKNKAKIYNENNKNKKSVYILAIIDKEIECWFRPSLSQLKKCYSDWMDETMEIYVCEWSKEATHIANTFADIDIKKMPVYGKLPDDIMYCTSCWIFYDYKLTYCIECNKECSNIE
jgi:hypothetical protein